MLSDYEKIVAVAAEEGINISCVTHSSECLWSSGPLRPCEHAKKWTYIQAVFFAATILTTIGK